MLKVTLTFEKGRIKVTVDMKKAAAARTRGGVARKSHKTKR